MSDNSNSTSDSKKGPQFGNLAQAILYFLRMLCKKNQSARVEYSALLSFLKKVMDQKETNLRALFTQDPVAEIGSQLEYLHQARKCVLELDNAEITAITYPGYFIDQIRDAYTRMEQDINVPFPTEEGLKITIPLQFVTVVNVKTDFMSALEQDHSSEPKIMKLVVPENVLPIIITSDLVPKKLLEYAAMKIKLYMENPRNSSYIEHKLMGVIKQKDLALREMLTNVMLKPGSVIQSFLDPTEFTFAFWAHFVNLIIQEYRKKDNKLPRENDICQAAHLLGLFNIYYKGAQQREKERQIALKIIEKTLQSPPYVFAQADVYRFKDKNGFPIIRKITKNEINDFLRKKFQQDTKDELPELLQLKTVDRNEFIIHRASIVPLCVRLVADASVELRKRFLARWINLLKNYRKSKSMTDDLAFLREVDAQVKERYPVLFSILNYELLYMARRSSEVKQEYVTDIERIFTKKMDGLAMITSILLLNRKEIYQEAKNHLPFWETIPVIGHIIRFIKSIFWGIRPGPKGGRPDEIELGGNTSKVLGNERLDEIDPDAMHMDAGELADIKSQADRGAQDGYSMAISRLESQLVGKQVTIDEKLAELAEKWNPLYDPIGKENLVDDVNSIIRDYLKNLRGSFRVKPPDAQRVRVLAETLSRNRSFDKIKKKNYFTTYIEIYMVKFLRERMFGKKRFR